MSEPAKDDIALLRLVGEETRLDRAYYNKTPAKTKDELELHIARIMCCRDECTKAHPLSEMELGGEGGCNMLRFAFDAGRVLDGIGAAGWTVMRRENLKLFLDYIETAEGMKP